jgi:hypothetical protein
VWCSGWCGVVCLLVRYEFCGGGDECGVGVGVSVVGVGGGLVGVFVCCWLCRWMGGCGRVASLPHQ